MDEAAIIQYITQTFEGVDTVGASGDTFIFYNPGGAIPTDHRFPFATLVTGDRHDTASNLDRPGVFRLNIGVSKATFRSLFGVGDAETSHDLTTLDRIMPHPVYGRQYWVCVLNPGEQTLATVKTVLAEAYERAAGKRSKPATTDEV